MTETKTILLIGRSGRGKSTLANVITGMENKFKESGSSASETKKIQFEELDDPEQGKLSKLLDKLRKEEKVASKQTNLDKEELQILQEILQEHIQGKKKVRYRIIDTPGIGDTKMSDNEVLDIIAEAVYRARDGISQVLFTVSDRFDQYEMATYNLLRTIIFDQDITKYTTIARTHFENFKSKKKCQTDINLMIEEAEKKKNELEKEINVKKEVAEKLYPEQKELKRLGTKIASKKSNLDEEDKKLFQKILQEYIKSKEKTFSSHSEQHQELQTEIKRLEKELKVTSLSEIIKSCQGKVIHVDNPSIIIDPADDEDEEEKQKREKEIVSRKETRNKSRKILLEHLQSSCLETYNPPNLKELSAEIADDYFQYMKKKRELEEELKKNQKNRVSEVKISENESKKTSLENNEVESVAEKEKKIIEESNTEELELETESINISITSVGIGERIKHLESKKTKLKKEIQEKERVIRQKVLKRIFNSYNWISNELGGDIFLESITKDNNNWATISPVFSDKKLILEWKSNSFDYHQVQKWSKVLGDSFNPELDAGFCVWLRDDRKLTVEKIKELNQVYDIEELRKEYANWLEKENEILNKHNKQLTSLKNMQNTKINNVTDSKEIHSDFTSELQNVTSFPGLSTLTNSTGNKDRLMENDYYEIDKIWYDRTYPNNSFKDEVVEKVRKQSKGFLPTKVIDIEEENIDEKLNDLTILKAKKTKETESRKGEIYALLSYVWGKKKSATELSRGGEKALVKADKACRLLGIRYLWMDQLCIDQDDPGEKNREIPKMKKYCDNAAVTLVAIQTAIFKKNFEEEDEGPTSQGVVLDLPNILRMVNSSEWFTRSWTFQEGWLSKHTLFMFDDYLIDGRALAETWVRHQSFAGNELGNNSKKIATPVGWIYKEDGHNPTDTVNLELHQALRAIKNRKRSISIDSVYSILGLLPYGDKVKLCYKKWGESYNKTELEDALSEVMRVAVENGYGEPLAWHGTSNKKLKLCWMPEIKLGGGSAKIEVEGGIAVRCYKSEVNKEDLVEKDDREKMIGIKITGRKYDISIISPDVSKIEGGIQIENGIHARSITVKKSSGGSSDRIILQGTHKTLEQMEENDILIIPDENEWKSSVPFALLVREEERGTYRRLGLVQFQNKKDLEKLERLANKEKIIIGIKSESESNLQYQTQIQIPPK